MKTVAAVLIPSLLGAFTTYMEYREKIDVARVLAEACAASTVAQTVEGLR